MQGLSKRQREIADFIASYITEKRHSPSYREIQHHFGFSSLGSVYNHIQILKKKGVLSKPAQNRRSLSLIPESKKEGVEIPLIGKLKGGMPIETFSEVSIITLPSFMVVCPRFSYLLQVIGSELEEEYIKEGDLLLVHTKNDFEDKDMILAQVNRQITLVKQGFVMSPYIRLESTNPEVQPLILREEHVQILGVIISLIRNYN